MKDYNVLTNERIFDRPMKNVQVTYDNLRNIITGKGDDYATICLLVYICFKNYHKIRAIALNKYQVLDVDSCSLPQIYNYSCSRKMIK